MPTCPPLYETESYKTACFEQQYYRVKNNKLWLEVKWDDESFTRESTAVRTTFTDFTPKQNEMKERNKKGVVWTDPQSGLTPEPYPDGGLCGITGCDKARPPPGRCGPSCQLGAVCRLQEELSTNPDAFHHHQLKTICGDFYCGISPPRKTTETVSVK